MNHCIEVEASCALMFLKEKEEKQFFVFNRFPLQAEGHEVLYLARSTIIQVVFGAKGSVWIVYEHADGFGDHCRRILNFLPFNGSRRLLQ